jgi:hypothetical protein
MTSGQLDAATRAFCRRRPFRAFLIEFVSGNQLLVRHPEVIRQAGELFVARSADGGFMTFAA